jgi:excisionase family DNA binding protein
MQAECSDWRSVMPPCCCELAAPLHCEVQAAAACDDAANHRRSPSRGPRRPGIAPAIRLRARGLARLTTHGAHNGRQARVVTNEPRNVAVLRPSVPGMVEPINVAAPQRVGLFTRHTLATYLGVHVNTIDRLIKRGELPAYRVAGKVRFYPADVECYIRKHREAV